MTHRESIRKVERDIDTLLELYQKQALDEAGFKQRYASQNERKLALDEGYHACWLGRSYPPERVQFRTRPEGNDRHSRSVE